MKSKAAVEAVLRHNKPDYIPLGTYVIDCDTVARVIGHETYVRDKVRIQLALWEGRRDEVAQSLKEDSVELFRRLPNIDLIVPFKEATLLPPAGYEPEKARQVTGNTWITERGAIWQCAAQTNDIVCVRPQPEPLPKLADMLAPIEVVPPDRSIFEAYDALVDAMKGERYLAGRSGGFEPLLLLGDMAGGMMLLHEEPELVKAATARQTAVQNQLDAYYIRPELDAVFIEQDFGTTVSTLVSPAMMREFARPAMIERVKNIHQYKRDVILHSCGNVRSIIPMMIEAGIAACQSLQTGAGMDVGQLKAEFGKEMAFWGGVSVETLISGTPEDVRANVREVMQRCCGEGAFILGPSHSIAFGVGYENFMAMLDEHDRRKYDL